MRGVRVMILACASVAAMAAMWMMRGAIESRAAATAQVTQQVAAPVAIQPEIEIPQTVDVLVAANDLNIGRKLGLEDMKWQSWPADSTSPYFYVKNEDKDAIANLEGAATRLAMRAGEPLTTEKVIDLQGAGVMASLLRNGMRAVAVPISDITGAGGFILPGDFVDLLLTRQISIEELDPKTGEIDRVITHNQTETVMETVRVLAIDQRLSDESDSTTAVGNTATIELKPDQVELITLTRQIAKQERGFLTLSLRSFAEMVEEYGEDIDKVLPVTVLDLQAIARQKVEAAKKLRVQAEEYQRELAVRAEEARKQLEIEEQQAKDAERARLAAEAAKAAQGQTVSTVQKKENAVVLVRNGAAIKVTTIPTDENTEVAK